MLGVCVLLDHLREEEETSLVLLASFKTKKKVFMVSWFIDTTHEQEHFFLLFLRTNFRFLNTLINAREYTWANLKNFPGLPAGNDFWTVFHLFYKVG